MNKERNHFKRKLVWRLIVRFFAEISIYTVGIIFLYFFILIVKGFWIWSGNEWIYPLLHWLNDRFELFLLFSLAAGYLIILIRCLMKPVVYLEQIVGAIEQIYNEKEDLIQLPSNLKEVERQMNHIKLNVAESKRAAKEAEQRKNDLVVYLAHDLKTPLTSVIGYLTLLRDEGEISPALREKYLSISLDKAERLEDLINEFFEITRFSLTSLTIELSRVNLTRMLEQLVYEFKPMFEEKGLECRLNAPPDFMMRMDVAKMQRVFDNLLKNAVNYSFEGGTIEIEAVPSEKEITLTVLNHGNTIPKEKLERIFEQFYRLDTARTSKSGGAGLGLAIAKEIVELHGGRITAFSEDEVIQFQVVVPVL